MLSLKKLKIFEQKEPGTCGPAALRILLSYFDIAKSEDDLARLCATTKAKGTRPERLAAGLEKLGFKIQTGVWQGKKASWQSLNYWINKRRLPVIVDWFSQTDGHYSVVYGLDKETIWLADPAPRRAKDRQRKMPWDDFCRVWFDFEGNYIPHPKDLNARWWLAAHQPQDSNYRQLSEADFSHIQGARRKP